MKCHFKIPPGGTQCGPQIRPWSYPVVVKEETQKARAPSVGLCADCRFMRKMESDRGSTFYLCQRSATDPTFPKYPRLPVLQCMGYELRSRLENADE